MKAFLPLLSMALPPLLALPAWAQDTSVGADVSVDASLPDTVVKGRRLFEPRTDTRASDASLGANALDANALAPQRAASPDTAGLLQGLPGISLQGAGGVSSLPAIRGLADERLRVQLDGMDLMAACPNHMNPALSYFDPSQVGRVTVFSGVTPVSVGGDSIGGTIQVESPPPQFAAPGQAPQLAGGAGTSYRSNGHGFGANAEASYATERLHLRYAGSMARAGNYRAAAPFKPVAAGTEQGAPIPGDEVASTAFRTRNHQLGSAWRQGLHLLQADLGWQDMPLQGFPNQRMDLTDNRASQLNLRYSGQYAWGDLKASAYHQRVRHRMDMGGDRYSYGTGMPMLANAATSGGALQANWLAGDRDTVRLGAEAQRYTLYDWWPPVGASGAMAPNIFWNIDYGQRHKLDLFAEWERRWGTQWTTLAGLRHTRVKTDAGPVQGYSGLPTWADDAAAFNARQRRRQQAHWDLTLLARYAPAAGQSIEAGYARKTRSPSLYQRYAWSTNTMAAGMNNFLGDGNGYIGNPDLKPEVAHTLSLGGDWREPGDESDWGLKANAYLTYIDNYIDAVRCPATQCRSDGNDAANQFVLLRYANQRARLIGLDLSGFWLLSKGERTGRFTAAGALNWLRGKNLSTGDGLYNTMPPNMRLSLEHRIGLGRGAWSTTLEWQGVMAKTRVSRVRNELRTAGYGLVHLRASYALKNLRLDMGVENLLNRLHDLPLGGAYVGQGSTMMLNTVPWGVAVPGRGRSFYVGLNLSF